MRQLSRKENRNGETKSRSQYFLHPRIAPFLMIVTTIVIGALVVTFGHGSLIIEIQVTLEIIAVGLFGFMVFGLHHGSRDEQRVLF